MSSTRAVPPRHAIATLLMVVLAAGCSARGTQPVANYQRQANAICAPAVETVKRLTEPVLKATLAEMGAEPFDPQELQEFYRALVPPTEQALERVVAMVASLRELAPAEERAGDFDQLWRDIRATMEEAQAAIESAADDPDTARELWDIDTSPFTTIDDRSRELGVHQCAIDR